MKRLTQRILFAPTLLAAALAFGEDTRSAMPLALADKLEQAIYLQEAEAKLDEAIKAYQSILAEANVVSALAAEAKYRLAICYLDQGKQELAMMTLAKLVSEHPDEKSWVDEAKKLLPQDFVPELTPWTDGERCHYRWTLPSGLEIGYSYSQLTKEERDGRTVWRIANRAFLNGDRGSMIEFDAETFESVYGVVNTGEFGVIHCDYVDGATTAVVDYRNSDTRKTFSQGTKVYDNEQAYALLRQIPVEIGYSAEVTLFVTFSGVGVPVRFEITSIEPRDTPLGKVDCYCVSISLPGSQQSLYFTADERRIPVGFEVGGVSSKLVKFDTVDADANVVYKDPDTGMSITHPDTWVLANLPKKPGSTETRIAFMEPMLDGIYSLYADTNAKFDDQSVLSGIDAFTQFLIDDEEPKVGSEYSFIGYEGEAFEINGMPAKLYRRHREAGKNGPAQNRYTYVALGEKRHFVVHAFLTEEQAKANLSRFSAMVETLHE